MSKVKRSDNMAGKMKVCKHCGAEIAAGAKICPKCGGKNSNPAGCIIGVIVFIAVVAVFGSNGSKKESSTKINQPQKTSVNAETDEKNQSTETQTSEGSNVVSIGGSFENSGLKVTVNSADTNYQVPDDKYGFYKLDEGMKYIAVNFTFENTGDGDKYVSLYDFDCYADNTSCEQKFINTSDKEDFINTNLSSGRNVTFTTYFAVPTNSQNIELEYETNMWSDEKVIVKVQ